MIDRLLQIHLEPVARDHRQWRMLRTLTRGWLAAGGAGLFLILVHRSTGWISPWLFLLLFVATLVWTFFIRRAEQTRAARFSNHRAQHRGGESATARAAPDRHRAKAGFGNAGTKLPPGPRHSGGARGGSAQPVAQARGAATTARTTWQRRGPGAARGRAAHAVSGGAAAGGDSHLDGSRSDGDTWRCERRAR